MALGRTERERRLLNRNFRKIQLSNSQERQNMAGGNTFTLKGLSKWSMEGLDLTDAGFSKLHAKESKFDSEKKKYDLGSETFRNYTKNLIEKVERIHAIKDFTVNITANKAGFILREYSLISSNVMKANRDERWPSMQPSSIVDQATANKFTDSQIKASVVGAYIHESLTDEAKEQLNADSDYFKVTDLGGNKYFDGPSYFHCIARLVDPDNGHLVAKTKMELRKLNAKDFNYDVKKLLADFKNMKTRVSDLGGEYSIDEQFLDLWAAVNTMKEKEFNRFVRELEDQESAKLKADRLSIEDIIRIIGAKQTRMEVKNEWNVMSQEDAMIMALTGILDKNVKSTNLKAKNNNNDQNKSNVELNDNESRKSRKRYITPEWKKIAPKDGEPKVKENDGKTYYWCTKCNRGEGMWAMHKVHDDNFKPEKRGNNNAYEVSDNQNKASTKKVSFASVEDKEENQNDSEQVEIKVKEELLRDAKSFLSQYTDFQTGGVHGA